MRSAVRKMGNSSGVIIPKPLLAEIGAKAGDEIEITAEEGRLLIAPVKPGPRAGWAEASRKIAEAGDDKLVWPEFGNDDDAQVEW